MKSTIRHRSSRSGNALIMALMLVVGLLTMGAAFFQIAKGGERRNSGRLDDERAFAVAEAGLNEAYRAIQGGGTGGVATAVAPAYFGGGLVWVDATDLGNDRIQLVSTGLVGSGRQALEVVVEDLSEDSAIFSATLNSKETLTLNEGVAIDSYDSEIGTYASQATNNANGLTYANDNGDVKSNEDIILNANGTVFGDATPGVGYGVSFATGASVTGSIAPATEPFTFPPIEVPIFPFPSMGAKTVTALAPQTIVAGDYDFTSLTINKDATLTVQGPANIVVDDFVGGKNATLLIDATNGPVTFYVENSYTHTAGFQADAVSGSPMAVAFLVNATQDLVFPSLTKVRGGYYLPNGNILFASGSECWGSFAANKIEMANDMKFHFDEALARYWEDDTGQGNNIKLFSWRPVPVADDVLRLDRRGPLTVLGLEKADLASPALSWEMP